MGLKFDLIKYLTPNFSNSGRQNFPKFSGNVEGSILYQSQKFKKNLSTKKISGSNFMKFGWGPSLPGGNEILSTGRGFQ